MPPKQKAKKKTKGKIRHALIIPDCHWPFVDQRAYNLMLAVATQHYGADNISEVIIQGDYADFYCVNSHGKDAELMGITLKQEVEVVNTQLRQLERLFPKSKLVYIEGNHEYRLQRYINSKCPDLFGLVDLPTLFGLNNWTYVPYTPHQLYQVDSSRLYTRHEPYGGGVHVAHGSVIKAGCSIIFGHVHRIQESQVVMADGSNHRGIANGWLGDKYHKVFEYVKNHHQWALAFSMATIDAENNFYNNLIHIINYKCNIGGVIYEG